MQTVYTFLMNVFVPITKTPKQFQGIINSLKKNVGKKNSGRKKIHPFLTHLDFAWRSLPMDNTVYDQYMRTVFTELWVPMSQCKQLMTGLNDLFSQKIWAATGYFTFEIYMAKKSDFWLSPSYNRDVVRFDIFWEYWNGDPRDFYQIFWSFLEDNKIEYIPHWGKYLPPNAPQIVRTLKNFESFCVLRERLDPNQIFLSDYWSQNFGIPLKYRANLVAPVPDQKKFDLGQITLPGRCAIAQGVYPTVTNPSSVQDVDRLLSEAILAKVESIKAIGTRYSYDDVFGLAKTWFDMTKSMNVILGNHPTLKVGENVCFIGVSPLFFRKKILNGTSIFSLFFFCNLLR